MRDLHDGHDRAVGLVVGVDQLADDRPVADAHVVRQDHRERLVADEVLGHEHRVPEAELLLLADVRDLGEVADVPDLAQHLDVALLLEQVLELVVEIEVVLDRALVGGGDDDDLLDPAATASSTAYWMIGLSTSGSISLGCAFVAGRNRVPQPAAGKTALRTRIEPLAKGVGWVGPV